MSASSDLCSFHTEHDMENRNSFFARLEPTLAPSEVLRTQLAYYLAKYGHRAQVRKEKVNGERLRYFEHLRRSALVLIDTLHCSDWELVCALLLHDALEDTKELSAELIELSFGPRVARIVRTVSKIPENGYLERLHCAPADTILVKACDRLDNVRSLVVDGTTTKFVKKQIKETRKSYLPLFRKVLTDGPPHYAEMINVIICEIEICLDKAQEWVEQKKRSRRKRH